MKQKKKIALEAFAMSDSSNNDFVPILMEGNEESIGDIEVGNHLPILPLRNSILFPGVILPISVGRKSSLKLIEHINKSGGMLGTVTQKDETIESPEFKDLHTIGTVAEIVKILEMPNDITTVILQGRRRFKLNAIVGDSPYRTGDISLLEDSKLNTEDVRMTALMAAIRETAVKIIKLTPNMPSEATFAIKNIEYPTFLINFICTHSNIDIEDKQELLDLDDVNKRAELLLQKLVKELQMLEIKNDIQNKAHNDMSRKQREYFLHQQMQTIQDELGGTPADEDVKELEALAKKKRWKKSVSKIFKKELKKLKRLNPSAPDYSVQLTYLQEFVGLPWDTYTKDNFDLDHAEEVLNRDHYGLDNIKKRIIEHLAVLKLKGDLKAPILCLHGPPGVGKTSLGKSVAEALGRKYIRMSLGGVHDESEIRGHRRTYIGAMPGRIIRGIKKAEASNPVFILDEIDKVGSDHRGDPSSALLEVLDPEQNNAFHDNYLDVDYDLSKVLFIATANQLNTIPRPLLDRMELIDINGYIIEEKMQIAKRHLIPKQLKEHGIDEKAVELTDGAIKRIAEEYTRESGVRALDKKIAEVMRKLAVAIAKGEGENYTIEAEQLEDYLGVPKFAKEIYEGNEYAGVVTGLAWTAMGGTILYVETSVSKGKGELTLTGNLGDVMKESATLALQYLRSNSDLLNMKAEDFDKIKVHLHVPEGAVPKDGPSAGITIATAIASGLTKRKVRNKLAMTGEITLRGKVLPVGGIKEKILAAKRAGIKDVILSSDNKKDVAEIKEMYLKGLNFHYVDTVADVLNIALLKTKAK
ncbi:ATP-dependent Lon protease [Balneicella halophila]|uniref:Lon protease n=1 Tax=Balneicella halophila TaxID=1537566 RepID=A0A7L4UP86_BALHA|nr:endopeptidase La [Balneicella halophila]PVX50980.1 ATP-dependent Lon protease [Balneicella halophila]